MTFFPKKRILNEYLFIVDEKGDEHMIHTITMPVPFAVGTVNAFLVKGDALTLFDAGSKTKEAYEALQFGLKEAGYTFKDVEQVVLTHHHPDHSGWVEAFDRATLLGHQYNQFWLTRDEQFFNFHDQFYYDRLVEEGVPQKDYHWIQKMKRPIALIGERPLDAILEEGDELPGHPGWTVLETLGHAQSHLSFWNERNRELIGGDLLLGKVSSNPLIEPPMDPSAERPRSLLQYNASLRRLLDLPIDVVYAGHGHEVRDVHPLIENRLQEQQQRAQKVYAMFNGGAKTIYELTQELFPAVYEKELGLTLSETIGQVDDLFDQALLTETITENGILYYAKK